jgi:hypothetical protein
MKRVAQEPIDLTGPQKTRRLVQSTLNMTRTGPAVVKPSVKTSPPSHTDGWYNEAVQARMREVVQSQLDEYRASILTPQCVFNDSHDTQQLQVAYKDKYYETLCDEFMASRGDCSEPPQSMESFMEYWVTWHRYTAHLRLLCPHCYRTVHPQYVSDRKSRPRPQEPVVVKKLQSYSGPLRDEPHNWLQLDSAWERTERGNYWRTLNDVRFTLFRMNDQWKWVYNNKFSAEHYTSVKECVQASYSHFRDLIHRCT